ncbi:dTDP-Rha:alpha-D-GlcNAc-pyrophosphate polyprenol, alpha-3-L-rhamnosyltransferase [Bacteroidales bacterium Barb6XT]|nr:dTDP-Rha:alpha-D-GlcNAc-pyrophosphate polyprenol, alpha-3-L-rhamnosyltransferase [Bacteroidales bacterium Barb6XT]
MKVSVILIGYNSWHFLEKNLASLHFLFQHPEAEIIYVDNASADGSVSMIQSLYPSVKIIENKVNTGVAVARNQGIRAASGEYLWILDSDTEATEEAFQAMLAFMESHPEAGLCGCKMYGQDGSVQDSCRPFPTVGGKLKAAWRIITGRPVSGVRGYTDQVYEATPTPPPFEVDYVIGACQFVRKAAQLKVGLLDEHIFYGPEDADFCLRMKQAGYKVYYLPQIAIYHAYQRVSSRQLFSGMNRKHIQGLFYYFRKHYTCKTKTK